MTHPDSVSCVVPAFNAARFLGAALESIFNQTHPPFEVIVVDDGSTDNTRDVARSFGDRLKVIEIGHGGYPGARDAGIRAARGEFIAFLDADDTWIADKTERQLGVFRERAEVDLCVGHYQNFWDEEIADEAAKYRDHPLSKPVSGYIVPTMLARRATFLRFGPFAAGEAPSDTSWCVRAVAAGARVETLPDVLLHRRLHRANHSRVSADPLEDVFFLIKARRRGLA